MAVHIRVLTRSYCVCQVLRDDGWEVEKDDAGTLTADHPEVPDQRAARSRLCRLGLLTSPRLRIEFEPKRLSAEPPR
jgi:hypothetical protein